jgi:hypothetical protein
LHRFLQHVIAILIASESQRFKRTGVAGVRRCTAFYTNSRPPARQRKPRAKIALATAQGVDELKWRRTRQTLIVALRIYTLGSIEEPIGHCHRADGTYRRPTGQQRPFAVAALEDKIVQGAGMRDAERDLRRKTSSGSRMGFDRSAASMMRWML